MSPSVIRTISWAIIPSSLMRNVTVSAAPLTVTAADATRTYGAANRRLRTITGIQNGDNITATYATASTPQVRGSYAIVPSLHDPDNKLGNYSVTLNNGTLTVSAAPLTVTAADATRTYGAANGRSQPIRRSPDHHRNTKRRQYYGHVCDTAAAASPVAVTQLCPRSPIRAASSATIQ